MIASVQERRERVAKNNTKPQKRGNPLYRIVKWVASDQNQDNMKTLWEGKEFDGIEIAVGLPRWDPWSGIITEFQVQTPTGWRPCRDPRLKDAVSSFKGPHSKIIVVDPDRRLWDVFWNFFESAVTTFIVALNLKEAENCFSVMPLGPRDAVIFTTGDGLVKKEVRSLRKKGFGGSIFVSEIKPRWRSRLTSIGCTGFFSKDDMLGLIHMLHAAKNA